jgi:hypothetical protein
MWEQAESDVRALVIVNLKEHITKDHFNEDGAIKHDRKESYISDHINIFDIQVKIIMQ